MSGKDNSIRDLALIKLIKDKFEPVESEINALCASVSETGVLDSINYVDPSQGLFIGHNQHDLYVSNGRQCFLFENIIERYNEIISDMKKGILPESIQYSL